MPSFGFLSGSWGRRSHAMRAVPILMTLSILLKAFTIVSRHWALCQDTGEDISVGLWSYLGGNLSAPPSAVPSLYAGFSLLSLLILFGDLTLAVMMVPRSTMFVLPALIAFALIAAGMEFMLMLLWQLPHTQSNCRIGFTFYLACASTFIDIAATACCIVELVQYKRLEASRRRVAGLVLRSSADREENSEEEAEDAL